jgi:hypothetical protein
MLSSAALLSQRMDFDNITVTLPWVRQKTPKVYGSLLPQL